MDTDTIRHHAILPDENLARYLPVKVTIEDAYWSRAPLSVVGLKAWPTLDGTYEEATTGKMPFDPKEFMDGILGLALIVQNSWAHGLVSGEVADLPAQSTLVYLTGLRASELLGRYRAKDVGDLTPLIDKELVAFRSHEGIHALRPC